jgi:dTMP kinase
MKSRLVAIEGIDGSGGETQSSLLLDYLREKGIPAVRLEYPDYSFGIGKLIHEYLHERIELTPEALFLLYATDMVKDQKRIKALLKEGKTVIVDRYITSAMAYQTLQGVSLEKILRFCETFEMQKPDVIIYLDISPKTSMERKSREKGSLDRFESRKEFLTRLRRSYKNLADRRVFAPWFVVDGEASREEVAGQIRKILRVRSGSS